MKQTRAVRIAVEQLLRQRDGPLTRELAQVSGEFGLGKVPAKMKPETVTRMICGFCSTGCSLDAHLQDGKAVNLSPTADYPVNLGMACPKGWEALAPLSASNRATHPLLKNSAGTFESVSWGEALQAFASRFKSIQANYGRASVAWLGSGQIVTEELALLGALGKFGMGMIHGDGNTRQCMATAVAAYKESFGFDAPPFTYEDFEFSDVIVLVGSNLCIAHPIMWQRVLANKNNPAIVVIDPRRTETAAAATHHFALAPKSDLVLLYGLANILIERRWINERYIELHTTGFAEFCEQIRSFTPELAARETGISEERLLEFAQLIHSGRNVSFWWTMGVNQGHEATLTAQAIINLALLTGNMGRPGTGANSITGQCNAMGSRLFSNTTNLFGGRDFKNPSHRHEVAHLLKIDPTLIPSEDSWAYDEIVKGIEEDKIKGLWIIGTNPSHSWIDQSAFQKVLARLEFLVVQDMYADTETAKHADLILPAAGWGEKEGTFINSERRFGVVKNVSSAPGAALADFYIFKLIAHYWGCEEMFKEWTSPAAAFQIIKGLSAGRPCDVTGIEDYSMLDTEGGIQWPWRAREGDMKPNSQRRLFEDGVYFRDDGKARFVAGVPQAVPEPVSKEYPFWLLTGRGTSAQWHTQTRTAQSSILRRLYPRSAYAEINPRDATRLNITHGESISVASRRGEIVVRAFVTGTVALGQIFIPMHYGVTNRLTLAVFDPKSRQPSYKACAVSVEAVPSHGGGRTRQRRVSLETSR